MSVISYSSTDLIDYSTNEIASISTTLKSHQTNKSAFQSLKFSSLFKTNKRRRRSSSGGDNGSLMNGLNPKNNYDTGCNSGGSNKKWMNDLVISVFNDKDTRKSHDKDKLGYITKDCTVDSQFPSALTTNNTPVIKKILYNPFNLMENPYLTQYKNKSRGFAVSLDILNPNKEIVIASISRLNKKHRSDDIANSGSTEESNEENTSAGSLQSNTGHTDNTKISNDTTGGFPLNFHKKKSGKYAELYGNVVVNIPHGTGDTDSNIKITNFQIKLSGYVLNFKCTMDPFTKQAIISPVVEQEEKIRVHQPFIENDVVSFVSSKNVLVLDSTIKKKYVFPFKFLINSSDFPSTIVSSMGKIEYRVECYLTIENIGTILLTDKINIFKTIEPASGCLIEENGTLERLRHPYVFNDGIKIYYDLYMSNRIIVMNKPFDFKLKLFNLIENELQLKDKINNVSETSIKNHLNHISKCDNNNLFVEKPLDYNFKIKNFIVELVQIVRFSNQTLSKKTFTLYNKKREAINTTSTSSTSTSSNGIGTGDKRSKNEHPESMFIKNMLICDELMSKDNFSLVNCHLNGLIPYYDEGKVMKKRKLPEGFITASHFLKVTVKIEDCTTLTSNSLECCSKISKKEQELAKIRKSMTIQIPIFLVNEMMISTSTLPAYKP